ncbi:retention module-containing protein, partial [Pseudomonas sp. GCM10022186]|uniref:retention module-containing protein n=1 Tax=Pseudomonas sp. GCM10022186 TaxID=3252650 RepID=UPI0036091BEA
MSSVIAIVKSIVGQVMAMSPEGFQRLLVEGDRLFEGDQLQTGLEGMVTLELADGRTLDLGHGTQWSEADAIAAVEPRAVEAAPQTPADGVAQLQKAIEAGIDPTRELEATAAGASAGGAGGGSAGGGHSFVMLDTTAARVDATIGFLTGAAPVAGEPRPEKESTPLNEAPLPPVPLPESPLPVEPLPVPDGPNSAPQGQDASITTNEDTPVHGQLGATDPDGDALAYSLGDGPRNGSLLIDPDGSYTYTPNKDFNGGDSFTAIVDDGKGGTATITITIGVNPVNDAPAAADDGPAAVTEDASTTGNVLANDSDVDGDSLTVTQFSIGGSNYQAGQVAVIDGVGSLVINGDGSYTFTPAPNYTGPLPIATYTVSDGSLTDTAELSLADVSPVNDAPETQATSTSGAEDAVGIPVALSGSDLDGSIDHFVIKSLPANGTLLLNGVALAVGAEVPASSNAASVTFVPNANWNGSTDFQYSAVDNLGLEDSSPATATVTVTPVNDAPETHATSASGNEDNPISVSLRGSDIDGSIDHFVIKSLPADGTLLLNGVALAVGSQVPASANGATVTFVPAANWNGSTNFDYAAVDGQGLEDATPATATISIAAVNDAPETAATSTSGAEDTVGIPVALSGSDLDGSVDHFVIKLLPVNGTLLLNGVALAVGAEVPAAANGATVTFVPNANWNGSTSFQYAAVDNLGLEDSSPATATVTVTPVNDAPETATTAASGAEAAAGIPVALSGSDVDGSIDHFVIQSLPANGTLLLNGVALAIGAEVSATANGATLTFVPNANWNGSTSFQYAAVDDLGLEDSSPATATVTVTPVNDAPETATTAASGAEDAAGIPVALSGSDLDGSVDHFVIKSLPANGTLLLNGVVLAIGAEVPATANGASVTFVPNANWNGSTDFQYAAVDNLGLEDSSAATATINVVSVNDAPETQA